MSDKTVRKKETVEVIYCLNKEEKKSRVMFVSETIKCIHTDEVSNYEDLKVLQELSETKGYPMKKDDLDRGITAFERCGFKLVKRFKVELLGPEMMPEKVIPKPNLDLEVCQEPKEHVPSPEYFLDVGIMDPIKAGVKLNKPVLLIGETGVGKTSAIRYLAAETKNGFRRVNLNGSTNVDDFVGKWKLNKDREMTWIDGICVDAMRKGHWLLVDEINACLPEISFVLHSLLDDDRCIVLTGKDNEVVKPHKDFRFFASMNPEYAGTHALNLALQDRFGIVVYVEYPKEGQELEILLNKSGNTDKLLLKKMIQVANKCRTKYKDESISTPFSTRRLIDWAHLEPLFGNGKSFYLSVLNKAASNEDRTVLKDIASVVFPDPSFKEALVI